MFSQIKTALNNSWYAVKLHAITWTNDDLLSMAFAWCGLA